MCLVLHFFLLLKFYDQVTFAMDSLYSHYAGIFLEKDSRYGCITNSQSCILSGIKKENNNPKLNL